MKEKLTEAYKNIKVSEKTEQIIMSKTIKKPKSMKIQYLLPLTSICFLLFVSVIYADEIKEGIKYWSSSIIMNSNKKIKIGQITNPKEIKKTALKTNDGSIELSYNEIETMLGFKILKLNENQKINYSTGLNKDGSIGRINLWSPEFIPVLKNKKADLLVSILSSSADQSFIDAIDEGLDATGDKAIIKTYKSNRLNTTVYIYNSKDTEKKQTATFIYDDIIYKVSFYNFDIVEVEETIEKMQ